MEATIEMETTIRIDNYTSPEPYSTPITPDLGGYNQQSSWESISRSTEVEYERPSFNADFFGCSTSQAESIQKIFGALGLYDAGVKHVRIGDSIRSPYGKGTVMGQYNFETGTYSITKECLAYPGAFVETSIHELAHAGSPFSNYAALDHYILENGPEVIKDFYNDFHKLLRQLFLTKTYINGYHRLLCDQFELGNISPFTLLEETSAILFTERFVNPNHLYQVNESMQNKLLTLPMILPNPVDLITVSNKQMRVMMDDITSSNHSHVEAKLNAKRIEVDTHTRNFYNGFSKPQEKPTFIANNTKVSSKIASIPIQRTAPEIKGGYARPIKPKKFKSPEEIVEEKGLNMEVLFASLFAWLFQFDTSFEAEG